MEKHKIIEKIDEQLEKAQGSSFRPHLGASVIGNTCMRESWYVFRWALNVKFQGRILRLFNRGHLEEARFIEWLENIGCFVWSVDKEGKQFKFDALSGHFAGSYDGIARRIPGFKKDETVLLEFKTHGEKSFKKFSKNLKIANFKHFVQMQIYMRFAKLKIGLYLAICKNTDEIYAETINYEAEIADRYLKRAKSIIFSESAPLKINQSPGWFQCAICNFIDICHKEKVADINCRTCAFSTPSTDQGSWICEKVKKPIPFSASKFGCPKHIFLPDMIGGSEVLEIGSGKKGAFIKFKLSTGAEIVHGPGFITSAELKNNDYATF